MRIMSRAQRHGGGWNQAKQDEGEGRHGEFCNGRLKKMDWDLIPIPLPNGECDGK